MKIASVAEVKSQFSAFLKSSGVAPRNLPRRHLPTSLNGRCNGVRPFWPAWELQTDVQVQLDLRGRKLEVSLGDKPAAIPAATKRDGWLSAELPPNDTPYRVRVMD